jgi:predicted phosphoribosyltransferase
LFRGKIRYHTLPPEDETMHLSAKIVSDVTDVFNLDNVQRVETEFMEELAKLQPESSGKEVKTDSMEVDGKTMVVVDDGVQTKKSGKLRWRKKKKPESMETKIDIQPGVIKLKKLQKFNAKKQRKTAARLIKCQNLLDNFDLL